MAGKALFPLVLGRCVALWQLNRRPLQRLPGNLSFVAVIHNDAGAGRTTLAGEGDVACYLNIVNQIIASKYFFLHFLFCR